MVEQLVKELAAKKIKLTISGDELLYQGPKSSVTREILHTLRNNKSNLLEYLKRDKSAPPSILGLILKPYGRSLFYFPDPNHKKSS